MTTSTNQDVLGKALGQLVTGVYILTTQVDQTPSGMIASWVMQAGFEPPMVTVAIQPDREFLKQLQQSGQCVINILSEANMSMMGRFSKYKPDAFEGLDTQAHPSGVILNDTVAMLSGTVQAIWPAGDHHIVLLALTDGKMLSETTTPWVHIRKNGFSY